jgi:hypothetical protein
MVELHTPIILIKESVETYYVPSVICKTYFNILLELVCYVLTTFRPGLCFITIISSNSDGFILNLYLL